MGKSKRKNGVTNLVNTIKKVVDPKSLATTMKRKVGRKHCAVDVADESGQWLIIDLDSKESFMNSQSLRPDFIFVSDDLNGKSRIVVVEISMGKNKTASRIRKQIQAGFDRLEKKLKAAQFPVTNSDVEAIGLFCGNPPKRLREELSKTEIKFGHTIERVSVMNCGRSLRSVYWQ